MFDFNIYFADTSWRSMDDLTSKGINTLNCILTRHKLSATHRKIELENMIKEVKNAKSKIERK